MSIFLGITSLPTNATQQLLYDYSAPAPQAYGGATLKTVESISRIMKYSRRKTWLGPEWVWLGMHNSSEIGFMDPSGLPSEFWTKKMVKEIGERWGGYAERLQPILEDIISMPATKLMKAKQTLSFTTGSNSPGSWEFIVLTDFLKRNTKADFITDSLISYCLALYEVFDLEMVEMPRYVVNHQGGSDIIWKKITHDEYAELIPAINTMLKTGERGRLKRRMIATTSMLVRPFVLVAETLVMEMLKYEESSVIHVGGEEKKAKMEAIIEGIPEDKNFLVISGDATKWNECLSPNAMGYFLTGFLQKMIDDEVIDSEIGSLVKEIVATAYGIFAKKSVLLGEGIKLDGPNAQIITPVSWALEHIKLYNEETQKNLRELDPNMFTTIHYPHGNSVEAYRIEPGMLMGMFNAGSTLYAIYSLKSWSHMDNLGAEVRLRQSSDDFELVYVGEVKEDIFIRQESDRRKWHQSGINISPEKTLMAYNQKIGELTSSYHTTVHWGNVSVDLPALIPQGVDPNTDYTLCMRFIHQSTLKGNMELSTCYLAIELFYRFHKFAYQIHSNAPKSILDREIQKKYNSTNVLHANGGEKVYSPSTVGFNEVILRKYPKRRMDGYRMEPIPVSYLEAVLTASKVNVLEKVDFLVEGKQPTLVENFMPHNVYNMGMRRNERVEGRQGPLAHERECRNFYNRVVDTDSFFEVYNARDSATLRQELISSMATKIIAYQRTGQRGATAMWRQLEEIAKKTDIALGFSGIPFEESTDAGSSMGIDQSLDE